MFRPIQHNIRIRLCLCSFVFWLLGQHLCWSQQSINNPNDRRKSNTETPVATARFASVPVLAVPQTDEATSEEPGIRLGVERAFISTKSVSFREKVARESPTILGNTSPMSVGLDFLVISSLTTRKAIVSFRGSVVVEPVTRLDFDISNQARQIVLSQFDPSIAAFLIGNDINRPDNAFFGPGLQQQNKIDEGEFNVKINKNWQNGLKSSIGYEPSLAYLFFPQGNGSSFNPTHSSDLVTRLEQPLLRGAGRDVNLVNLRVVESKAKQSLYEIETTVLSQLRSIEQLYWKLHAEYVRLRAIDAVIVLSQQALFVVNARFEAERVIYSDVARAEVKLEDFFQQRLAAEQAIREASLSLAQLAGFELDSTVLLVPSSGPEFHPPQFDEESIVSSAIAYNPELRRQRQAIEIGRQTSFGAQNALLPQLNLQAAHRTSGVEDDLGSSLKQMSSFQFNDFTLGLQLTQQLGTRQARSQLTTAKLQIAREQAILEALERRVGFDILQELSRLKQIYQRYESALRQVEQSKKWVEIARTRYEDPPVSLAQKESFLVTLVDYQSALQAQVDSIVLVANTLAEFNAALAIIEERRGTLMAKWGIGTNCIDPQETGEMSGVMPQSEPEIQPQQFQTVHSQTMVPNSAGANRYNTAQSTTQSDSTRRSPNQIPIVGGSNILASGQQALNDKVYVPPLYGTPR